MLPNTRTNYYRPFENKSQRRTQNYMSEFRELPYIILRLPSILSISLIILSFQSPNYIGEKAVAETRERRHGSLEVTPSRQRGINISRQAPPQTGVCC